MDDDDWMNAPQPAYTAPKKQGGGRSTMPKANRQPSTTPSRPMGENSNYAPAATNQPAGANYSRQPSSSGAVVPVPMSSLPPGPPPTHAIAINDAQPDEGLKNTQVVPSQPGGVIVEGGMVTMMLPPSLFHPQRLWYGVVSVLVLWLSYLFLLIAIASSGWGKLGTTSVGLFRICYGDSCGSTIWNGNQSVIAGARGEAVITMIFASFASLYWIFIALARVIGAASRIPLVASYVKWCCGLHLITALFGYNALILCGALFSEYSISYCFPLWIIGCIIQTIGPCILLFALQPTN